MQRAWLLPVSVVAVTIAVIVSSRPPPERDERGDGASSFGVAFEAAARNSTPRETELLDDLEAYVDPDFGFSVAVPAGWTSIVVPETDAELAMFEPGYAIAFESRPQHDDDVFKDYLMIEIMPGDDSGLFETDGSRRSETVIDGRRGWRDALSLPADPDDERTVDLVVRQAAMSGLGYTIGFYAIGEPARITLIEDAFEAMLRTFHLPRRPFDVS